MKQWSGQRMMLCGNAPSPHKTMPKVMTEGLMKETIKRLNVFLAQNGTSSVHGLNALLREPKHNATNIHNTCWENAHKQVYPIKL